MEKRRVSAGLSKLSFARRGGYSALSGWALTAIANLLMSGRPKEA